MTGPVRPYCLHADNCKAAKPTTHCRACSIGRVHRDPQMSAERISSIKANFADPVFRAAHIERACATLSRTHADPVFREANRERGRQRAADVLNRPDIRAKSSSPESRARAGRKTSAARMGWCPEHLRPAYRKLVYSKQIKAADARRMIEAEIPGTEEHARRSVANSRDAMRIRHERDRASQY